MNYQGKVIRALLSEAREGIQYRRLPTFARIFAFIALLPIIIIDCVLIAEYYALLFIYKAASFPVESLEAWLDGKREGTRHATEAVLYLVAMPWIFFCRVWLSICTLVFFFLWLFIMAATYLVTLGGVRWQPFINEADFDGEHSFDLKPSRGVAVGFTIGAFAVAVLTVIARVVWVFTFSYPVYLVYDVVSTVLFVLTVIVNPLLFRKRAALEAESNDASAEPELSGGDEPSEAASTAAEETEPAEAAETV